MTKSSRTWWDRLLFRGRGMVPTKRLIIFYGFLFIPIAAITLVRTNWLAFIIVNLFVFLVSLIDYWRLPRYKELTLRREDSIELERARPEAITIQLINRSSRPIIFQLVDHLPASFDRPFPINGQLAENAEIALSYKTKASERGDYTLGETSIRVRSSLSLWQKQFSFYQPVSVKVIPDMTMVREVIHSLQTLLTTAGTRIKRNRLGSGEFAQVRTYEVGDDPRKMNWRQTAKQAELMTNVYEPEHGKQITLLIDCGRTMGVELKEVNRLERSLEAALTVAAGALQQGDYVSVLAFSNHVKVYVPPGKGIDHFKTILAELYHLKSDGYETNFSNAFAFLNQRQSKRSLLMLFSDLDTFLYEETAFRSIGLLKRRHFLLILSISDPILEETVHSAPETTERAFMISIAEREIMKRRHAIKKWSIQGQSVIEVPEEQLAVTALSRYIDVINRNIM